MNHYLVLTVIADDRPGIVEKVAQAVTRHQGNWMESSMARLVGKFAGILLVEVSDAEKDSLIASLAKLSSDGINITVEDSNQESHEEKEAICIEIVANDRAGIVGEISSLMAQNGVNLESLETFCESAPMSADMMFHAEAYIQLPDNMSREDLTLLLESLSDDLMVETID